MKIGIIIPKYSLIGGGERFAYETTQRIALNNNYEIHIFANSYLSKLNNLSNKIIFHKIPIIKFPRFLITISFAWFVKQKISQLKKQGIIFDLIHTHDRIFEADIFTMHSIPHQTWIKEIRKKKTMSLFDIATSWVEKKLIESNSCSYFLPVSNLSKNKILEKFKIDTKKISVICPGVDLNLFKKPNLELKNLAKERFGVNKLDFIILFVGMNFEEKNLESLILILSKLKNLKNLKINFKLMAVGKGNQAKYKKIAQKLGVEQDIIFTGAINKSFEQVYFCADVLILLSKFDTFGMVVLEAMACGLPVILNNFVGAKDLIENGSNGFIINKNNIDEAINETVDKIIWLTNCENKKKVAQKAYETAQNYSWDNVTKSILNVYSKILTKKLN